MQFIMLFFFQSITPLLLGGLFLDPLFPDDSLDHPHFFFLCLGEGYIQNVMVKPATFPGTNETMHRDAVSLADDLQYVRYGWTPLGLGSCHGEEEY